MMIPTIKNSPILFAALTATALLVFQPSPASARTTLQLDNGNVPVSYTHLTLPTTPYE